MLCISKKIIDLENSECLYSKPFTEKSFSDDWDITGGNWTVCDEWLTGYYKENAGGLVYLKQDFPGDVLIDFEGRTVPPCANDLNFSFRTEGWDYSANDAGRGYIAGLGGWWNEKTGIEHYPQCKPWAATPLFKLIPGQTYHIQAGSIADHSFIFVNGQLIVELFDPLVEKLHDCHKVGLGTYCSHVQFRNMKVLRPSWKHVDLKYVPNF